MLGGWMLRLLRVQHAFQRRPVNIVSAFANGLCSSLRHSSALAFARRPSLVENARFAMSDASYGNFDLVKRVPVDKTNIIVSKWRSRVTGLSVVHIDYEAPIVKGYFAVATEIFNDSGCPHTLEHLIFMGSEQYPYKGVLDNLANRAFSEGTNAWTENDNTVYTVSTAGQQGFLQLLPIYVDHILYPTIQKAGYITEVHHIDGQGNDSGVVYSEMQGVENTSSEQMQLKAQQTAYPPGSAYRSETGGLMGALRVLDVDTIRAYHKSYYVPHNLCLIVAGSLSTQALLDTLQKQVEPQIIKHGQAHGPRPDGWKRPFVETASSVKPEMEGVRKELAEFPEKDESSGELAMYLLGPHPNDDLTFKALDVMGLYLADSAAAPLNKEFVEIPSPYCTYVAFSQSTRATFSELNVYFGSVPTEHLETLDDKFRTCLARIAKEGIDMDRMSTIIKRDQLKHKSYIENSGGDVYSQAVISDFLYGDPNGGDMPSSLREFFEELKLWTAKDWVNLLSKYLIDAPYIAVRGKPSAALAEKLEKDERARLDAQIAKLGPEGLARLQKELDNAKAENDAPIPEKVLTDFPVPEVCSISWITVQSAKNVPGTAEVEKAQVGVLASSTELARHLKADKTKLPLTVYYDHVTSDFVSVHALMNLASVANEDRPYVVLYLNALFTLPLSFPDGTRLTHEEVINLLDKETVNYDANFGVGGAAGELLCVSIKIEVSKYATGVSLLRDLIYHSEFAEDRLGVTIAKLQQSLPQYKRDGNGVAAAVSTDLRFDESCTARYGTVTGMMEWVPRISKELKESPKEVVRKMKKVQAIMTDPSSFRFSVTGNVLDTSKPKADWEIFRPRSASGSTPPVELAPIRLAEETLSELGKKPSKKAVVLSLPTIESSFAVHTARCFSGYTHPDYPALRVAMEVLNGTESFLWRYIRGSGLAYGASTGIDLECGHISFTLYRSPNSHLAFQQGAKVIKGLTDGTIELKQTDLDAAKSSLVYTYTRRVSSPTRAAIVSFVNQAVKGVDQTWEQQILEQFNAVTIDEVSAALKKYLLPVFDPATSIAVVASAPGKVDEIARGLAEVGFQVEKRELDVDADELAAGAESGSGSGSESEEEEKMSQDNPFGDEHVAQRGRSKAPRLAPRNADQHRKQSHSMSASTTAQTAPPPPPKTRRSMSQDQVVAAAASLEKHRKAKASSKNKNGERTGLHVDVIDRLDYSGVGPATFHHDGPFDACAPSRNRHRKKAPMLAWAPPQGAGNQEGIHGVPATTDPRLSPLAQATITAMTHSSAGDSPYSAAISNPGKKGKPSKDTSARRLPPDLDAYYPAERPTSPKRRETIADAWGKGEPEPFEEFFAGSVGTAVNGAGETGLASAASSIYGGKEGHGNPNGKRRERPLRRPTKNLPPPMPIFPPEGGSEETPTPGDVPSIGMATSPGLGTPGGPKRSRSLMHRIRKMREQPNVPVGYEPGPSDEDPSSSSENQHGATRPSHRHQQSLLGKFGNRSPTSPTFAVQEEEKDLPGPPLSPRFHEQDGYFSAPPNSGVGRKTSIMQRVRGAVSKGR